MMKIDEAIKFVELNLNELSINKLDDLRKKVNTVFYSKVNQ